MEKFDNAMNLLTERCGGGKDNLIALATIALDPAANGAPQPSVRMVDAYFEDGAFWISTNSESKKMKEIAANPHVAIGGMDWFVASATAENLGWVKSPENAEILAKMRTIFAAWFPDHGNEDSPTSIVLKLTPLTGTITDNEMKYGQWRYQVDFQNRTAE